MNDGFAVEGLPAPSYKVLVAYHLAGTIAADYSSSRPL